MSTLYFVRHGESEANAANRVSDDPRIRVGLTARGRQQCLAAANDLRTVSLAQGFTSEFPRAQETLDILLQHHPDVPRQVDPRLNEWRTGLDGAPIDYFHDQMEQGFQPAESFDSLLLRMQYFVDDLKRLPQGSGILVVSHKITIVAGLVVTGLMNMSQARRASIGNCEIIPIPL